jgi:hypothetical protein
MAAVVLSIACLSGPGTPYPASGRRPP